MQSSDQNKLEIPDVDGVKLRIARQNRGLAQEQLAKVLCLSRAHIDQLETGGSSSFFSLKHRYQVALKVAHYLGLNANDIKLLPELITPLPIQLESLLESNLPKSEVVTSMPVSVNQVTKVAQSGVEDSQSFGVAFPQSPRWSRKWLYVPTVLVLVSTIGTIIFTSWVEADQPAVSMAVTEKEDVAEVGNQIADLCTMSFASVTNILTVDAPIKKGDSVTVVSKIDQPICVVDNNKKVTSLNLLPEGKQVIIGQAPFMIQAMHLNNLEIYFQGRKVRYATDLQGPIKLTEGFLREAAN